LTFANLSAVLKANFKVHSEPDWLRDKGTCSITYPNFNIIVLATPINQDGNLTAKIDKVEFTISDFSFDFKGTTDISVWFDNIFKDETFKGIFRSSLNSALSAYF
jgi:hypothetical protein